uniref:NadR/Ttd14 AAA domain-containing protein n=1 Tax=Magallana gigas TaxID=29159 RepID=K1QHJ3_MAGGI
MNWKVRHIEIRVHSNHPFIIIIRHWSYRLQRNLIKTMMQIEDTFFDLANTCEQNCLLICDRGLMDASAYLDPNDWERMKAENGWHSVQLRDNRYNQIIHMVSAANGAEPFYTLDGHNTRHEGLETARKLDEITAAAWVGHPYYDVIDNNTGFEEKVNRMISTVCSRLGIEVNDRLSSESKKRKFLVKSLAPEEAFPGFQDFDVQHYYLSSPSRKTQARIRRRGQNGNWTYTHTMRRQVQDSMVEIRMSISEKDFNAFPGFQDFDVQHYYLSSPSRKTQARIRRRGQNGNWTYTHTMRRQVQDSMVEIRMSISEKDFNILHEQKDSKRHPIYKKRRCFLWNNQYFHLDIYKEPSPERCKGLILLETYTALKGDDLPLPDFLEIEREVTGLTEYSMYNLSLKE